jgi:inner membrane protein YidH
VSTSTDPRDAQSEAGSEPDPRFTFANERTYLAWSRTSLALIVGGLAVAQFVKVGIAGLQLILAIPLIALGGYLSLRSYLHWQQNERALRVAAPLPASSLPRVLVYGIAVFAVAAVALAIIHFTS